MLYGGPGLIPQFSKCVFSNLGNFWNQNMWSRFFRRKKWSQNCWSKNSKYFSRPKKFRENIYEKIYEKWKFQNFDFFDFFSRNFEIFDFHWLFHRFFLQMFGSRKIFSGFFVNFFDEKKSTKKSITYSDSKNPQASKKNSLRKLYDEAWSSVQPLLHPPPPKFKHSRVDLA